MPNTGRGEYIIGTDERYFYNVCIRDTKVLMNHRMILAEPKEDRVRRNRKY